MMYTLTNTGYYYGDSDRQDFDTMDEMLHYLAVMDLTLEDCTPDGVDTWRLPDFL